MKSIALILLFIGMSSAYFLGKRSDNEFDNIMSCSLVVSACNEPIQRFIGNKTLDQIFAVLRRTGLRVQCPKAKKMLNCFKKAIVSDSCNQLPAPVKANFKQSFSTFSRAYQGVCIDEIDEIEADKECLFSERAAEVIPKCVDSWHASGELCRSEVTERLSCVKPALGNMRYCPNFSVQGTVMKLIDLHGKLACSGQP